jgi:hypothetical protein
LPAQRRLNLPDRLGDVEHSAQASEDARIVVDE